jgi:hypothetical protein
MFGTEMKWVDLVKQERVRAMNNPSIKEVLKKTEQDQETY